VIPSVRTCSIHKRKSKDRIRKDPAKYHEYTHLRTDWRAEPRFGDPAFDNPSCTSQVCAFAPPSRVLRHLARGEICNLAPIFPSFLLLPFCDLLCVGHVSMSCCRLFGTDSLGLRLCKSMTGVYLVISETRQRGSELFFFSGMPWL
jgi:hypothetical protein